MDDTVKQAMARWPQVPSVEGWLRLDQRGIWHLIDRNQPHFNEEQHGRGSPITNAQIIDFIGRNYEAERNHQGQPSGRWYWQNGPQRVFVSYEIAPLILRILQDKTDPTIQRLMTHTGYLIEEIFEVSLSGTDHLLISTNLGPGLLHDLDLAQVDMQFDTADRLVSMELLGKRWAIR
jgi:hypothetical protein